MLKGFYLTLMIGPAVPLPVSKDVLDALASVQVTTSTDGPSVFQLTFNINNRSPLQTLFLLSGGSSIPLVRVVLIATVNGSPETLIDGVMTHQQLTPGTDGNSTLTISGDDLTAVMKYIDFSGFPFPAMPPERAGAAHAGEIRCLWGHPHGHPQRADRYPHPHRSHPAPAGHRFCLHHPACR